MSIQDQLNQSLQKGIPLSLGDDTYNALLELSTDKTNALLYVSVGGLSLPASPTLSHLQGLFGSNSVSSLVPDALLPLDGVNLTMGNVGFVLATGSKKILQVSATINFSGMKWSALTIGTDQVLIALDSIHFSASTQGSSLPFFMATAYGTASIDSCSFDVTVGFPGGAISLRQPQGSKLDLGTFCQSLSLPVFAPFDKVALENIDFSIDFGNNSFDLQGSIKPANGSSLDLVTGWLELKSMYMSLGYGNKQTTASVQGQLLVGDDQIISLVTMARLGAGSWDFDGYIDIPETAQNLINRKANPVDPAKVSTKDASGITSYFLPLSELFPNDFGNLPEALQQCHLNSLEVQFGHDKGGSSYSLIGGLSGNWSLGDEDLQATVDVTLSSDEKDVSANFSMDGFDFKLSCKFGKTSNISVSMTDKIGLDLSGTYVETDGGGSDTTLSVNSLPNLGKLMAWFVERVSGDPFYTLPEPWNSAFSDISFDSVLQDLTFGLKIVPGQKGKHGTKSMSCTLKGQGLKFLGIVIESITLGYDSSKRASGGSGLTFSVAFQSTLPYLQIGSASWDPVKSAPPSVPAKSKPINLQLLALGQHLAFNSAAFKGKTYGNPSQSYVVPPTNVSESVADLSFALSNLDGKSSPALSFSQTNDWMIAAHAIFMGQADVKLIFNDPQLYGLRIVVKESKKSKATTLDKFAGLEAEILYRKVNDTVGEYKGSLILPSKINKMQFGVASVTLPFISVSIYTNGDFAFDIGFPYNMDFTHSVSVTAEGFNGAGGFYFAKLDGLAPTSLPNVTNGTFNPVTELGVGLRIGREISFQKGPLSASASLMLEAMFQGTLAKFHSTDGQEEAEYYDLHAAVEIIGHIEGSINFAIVTASLSVTAYVRADAHLIAYEPCEVSVTAHVDVELTVTIHILFTIHIHCSFSTTFQTQATLGHAVSPTPWQIGTSGESGVEMLKSAFPASDSSSTPDAMEAAAARPSAFFAMPDASVERSDTTSKKEERHPSDSIKGEHIPNAVKDDKDSGNISAVGEPLMAPTPPFAISWQSLSATEKMPINLDVIPQATATGPDSWYYVAQLAMNLDESAVNPSVNSFKNLVEGLVVWALYAIAGQDQPSTYEGAKDLYVSTENVETFLKALNTNPLQSDPEQPHYNPRNLHSIAPNADDLQTLFTSLFEVTLGRNNKELPKGYKSVFFPVFPGTQVIILGANGSHSLPADNSDAQQEVFTDFILVLISNALGKAKDLGCFQKGKSYQIGDVLPLILAESALSSIAGLTSRFMLHGLRYQQETPLYEATGQQKSISLTEESMQLRLILQGGGASWGVTGSPVMYKSVSPKATSGMLVDASAFTGSNAPVLDTSVFKGLSLMPLALDPAPRTFQMHLGMDMDGGGSLWHLPKALINGLSSEAVDPSLCSINKSLLHPAGQSGPPEAGVTNYVTTVDFRIKKIALPQSGQQKSGFITDTYQISSINPLGILRLEQILKEISAQKVASVEFAYASGQKVLLMKGVLLLDEFLMGDSIEEMLFKLLKVGVRSGGNTFLYDPSKDKLPDSLFDQNHEAQLTAVIKYTDLRKYTNAVTLSDGTDDFTGSKKKYRLYAQYTGEKVVRTHYKSSQYPVQVTRDVSRLEVPGLANLLNNLYHLVQINGSVGAFNLDHTIGPINDKTDPKTWLYQHVFSPVPSFRSDGSGVPPKGMNPYAPIYNRLKPVLSAVPIDFYGNEWSSKLALNDLGAVGYIDHVINLKHLPYLHMDYCFDDEGNINLNLSFQFPGYGSKHGQVAPIHQDPDRWAYAQAIYQFSDPKLKVSVSTDFSELTYSDLNSTIQQALNACYKMVDQNAGTGAKADGTQADTYSAILKVTPGTINSEVLFPLTLQVSIERASDLVQSGFQSDRAVQRSSAFISPHAGVKGSVDSDSTSYLKNFAEQFNEAYSQQMAIAVGPLDRKGADPNGHQVWVVRFGKEAPVNIGFGQPRYYYSPKPLANQLLSRAGIKVGADYVTVTNVDLDAEMRKFLAAFDGLFTPEMLVSAVKKDPTTMQLLVAKKQELAGLLSNFILPTSAATEPDAVSAAKNLFEEACTQELSNFYKMDAALVLPVNPNKTLTADFNFDGALTLDTEQQEGNDPSAGTFMTGRAPIPKEEASFVAFGVYPKQLSKHKQLAASLGFQLTAIEHDMEKFAEPGTPPAGGNSANIKVGSWIKLVVPPLVELGEVAIPLPLRSFPTPPTLGKLYAEDLANLDPLEAKKGNTVDFARSWSLNGEYFQHLASQDSIGVSDVASPGSTKPAAGPTEDTGKPDLLDALVQFQHRYQEIEGQLVDELGEFLDIVSFVVQSNLSVDLDQHQSSKLPVSFVIQESAEDEKLTVKVTSKSNQNTFIPYLSIPGYAMNLEEGTGGAPSSSGLGIASFIYQKQDSPSNPFWNPHQRTLLMAPAPNMVQFGSNDFGPYDIFTKSSGYLMLKVLRNQDLPEGFRYESAWVGYKSKLSPSLYTAVEIDITPATDIADSISGFFGNLLPAGQTNVYAQVVASRSFPTSDSANLMSISVPLLMLPPTQVASVPSALADGIAAQKATGILLNFDMSFFDENGNALLRLTKVRLDGSKIG